MSSSRLPGKVLKHLAGRPVIDHVVERARGARLADVICLATSTDSSDDPIAAVAKNLNCVLFRGDLDDVLGRYTQAARSVVADIIVRVTADCPLLDPAVCDAVIAFRAARGADYASNGLQQLDWPHGLDCEVFTRDMLETANRATQDRYDREHVTPFILNHLAKLKLHLPGPGGAATGQRWVIDYPEDYDMLQRLFALMPRDRRPSWREVMAICEAHPEIGAINRHLHRVELTK
jgi:spore coat polysaccharide biosynthesis protein SpsF (cytidylyltransferase family)